MFFSKRRLLTGLSAFVADHHALSVCVSIEWGRDKKWIQHTAYPTPAALRFELSVHGSVRGELFLLRRDSNTYCCCCVASHLEQHISYNSIMRQVHDNQQRYDMTPHMMKAPRRLAVLPDLSYHYCCILQYKAVVAIYGLTKCSALLQAVWVRNICRYGMVQQSVTIRVTIIRDPAVNYTAVCVCVFVR